MSSDVTRILSAIEQGDPHAAEQLLPLVYDPPEFCCDSKTRICYRTYSSRNFNGRGNSPRLK